MKYEELFGDLSEKQEKAFNIATQIFQSDLLPLGCVLGCSDVGGANALMRDNQSMTINLDNGPITFASKRKGSNLKLTKPDGSILYYQKDQKNKPVLEDEERIFSEDYVKMRMKNKVQVYSYDAITLQKNAVQSPTAVNFDRDSSGQVIVKKRNCFELDEDPAFLASMMRAIQKTAEIQADIFGEFCKPLVRYIKVKDSENNNERSYRVIETSQPYLGDSLDVLLSENALTPEDRIEIAKQCISLVCGLNEGSLSRKGIRYVHGNIKPEHFCVKFERGPLTNQETIKVSLIGMKVEPAGVEKARDLSGYSALEFITHKGTQPSFRTDVYSLGVLLSGYHARKLVPNTRENRRNGTFSFKATDILLDVEGLLSNVNPNRLNDSAKRKYEELMRLAEKMKDPVPERRPNMGELKIAAELISLPGKKLDRGESINLIERENIQELVTLRRCLKICMEAVNHYQEYREEKQKSGFLSFNWLKRNSMNAVSHSAIQIAGAETPQELGDNLANFLNHYLHARNRSSFTQALEKTLATKTESEKLMVNTFIESHMAQKNNPVKPKPEAMFSKSLKNISQIVPL